MRRTATAAVYAVAAAVALTGLTGCGGSGSGGSGGSPQATAVGTASASASPLGYGCLTPAQAPGAFQLEVGDQPTTTTTDAFAAGHGPVGVVFAHMAGESVCEWAPYVSSFAAKGYLALTFTSVGSTDQEIADAVAELKRRGARRVLLVGGSKGGTGVLVAASRPLALPVVAVVSLSGPTAYAGMDASAAVPRLTVPVFFMADSDDEPFTDDARTLAAAAVHAPVHPLKLYPGSNHASAVLGDRAALADFDAFVARYAPPG